MNKQQGLFVSHMHADLGIWCIAPDSTRYMFVRHVFPQSAQSDVFIYCFGSIIYFYLMQFSLFFFLSITFYFSILCSVKFPVAFSLYGYSPYLGQSSARMSAPSVLTPLTPLPPSSAVSPTSPPLPALSAAPQVSPSPSVPRLSSPHPTPSAPMPISQRYRPYSLSSSLGSSFPVSPSPRSGLSTPTHAPSIPLTLQPAPLPSPRHHTRQTPAPFSFVPGSPTTTARRTATTSWMPPRYLLTVLDVTFCPIHQ